MTTFDFLPAAGSVGRPPTGHFSGRAHYGAARHAGKPPPPVILNKLVTGAFGFYGSWRGTPLEHLTAVPRHGTGAQSEAIRRATSERMHLTRVRLRREAAIV
jgi:hypothetical protein